jgi:hypothetical protein
MRLLLAGSALAWIGLAVSPAAADGVQTPYTRYRYASCICHFGPSDTGGTCVPKVSCYTQGGRCGARCPPQTGN